MALPSPRGDGWHVADVSAQNRGYDLPCRRSRDERHVEVKGARGGGRQFVITARELATWKKDERFVLAFVGFSLQARPSIAFFPGTSGREEFALQPLAYMASRVANSVSRPGSARRAKH